MLQKQQKLDIVQPDAAYCQAMPSGLHLISRFCLQGTGFPHLRQLQAPLGEFENSATLITTIRGLEKWITADIPSHCERWQIPIWHKRTTGLIVPCWVRRFRSVHDHGSYVSYDLRFLPANVLSNVACGSKMSGTGYCFDHGGAASSRSRFNALPIVALLCSFSSWSLGLFKRTCLLRWAPDLTNRNDNTDCRPPIIIPQHSTFDAIYRDSYPSLPKPSCHSTFMLTSWLIPVDDAFNAASTLGIEKRSLSYS